MSQADLTTEGGNVACGVLPHLTGTKLGIEEALDKAGLRGFLRGVLAGAELARERMSERLGDREALDALRAPLSRNLGARYAPHLFCVILEKRAIQAVAEAVDEKIFEGVLRVAP